LSKVKERILLLISDIIFINLGWALYYFVRVETGWIKYTNPPVFLLPMVVIYLYWLLLFVSLGLYQHWYVRSRFDEFSSVVKVITLGCFILFFAIFIDDFNKEAAIVSRFIILIYWSFLIFFVSLGRVLIRGFQIKLLQNGIGLRNAVIIGTGAKAVKLNDLVAKYPQLGYKVIGFIGIPGNQSNIVQMGILKNIKNVIQKFEVSEILVALEPAEKDFLLETINLCTDTNVNIKIMPDMYEIISGMAKTNQIYGIPLIDVLPQLLPVGSRVIKKLIDILISIVVLVLLSPLLIFISLMIKLTSRGPVFYSQERVGRNGKIFKMHKFRSMKIDAEGDEPIWASRKDPRNTPVGNVLRKSRIDEIPQFINVLKNEMSIVGPRPERPFFVEKLKKEIPYYNKRLSIKPGITGWAQVKHTYDSSLDDVKTKVQYDFYYIENMSLSLDFKIMVNTIIVIILMKGY
jgi:exopolysaccharide biosynthesis polyprenyl glycosylphosphotransferase